MEVRPYFAAIARELDINYAYVVASLMGQAACFDNIILDPAVMDQTLRQLDFGSSI